MNNKLEKFMHYGERLLWEDIKHRASFERKMAFLHIAVGVCDMHDKIYNLYCTTAQLHKER